MSIGTENGMQQTLTEYMPEIFPMQTAGASDSLVRISASPEGSSDLKEIARASFSELCIFLDSSKKKRDPNGYSSRMLRICFQLMGDGILPGFSVAWMRGGYDAEWQVLNSKDFGVPQNRERVFIIGHLRGRGGREVLSFGSTDEEDTLRIKQIGRMPSLNRDNPNSYRVYDTEGISPTLSKVDGGGREPHIIDAHEKD